MRTNRFGVIVAAVVYTLFCQTFVQAQTISFSTDFDGRGTGSSISVDFSKPSAGRPSTSTRPSSDSAAVQQYLDNRYQEQVREVKRRADEERLQLEVDLARRRNDVLTVQRALQQLQILQQDEPSVVQRAIYTRQVLNLQKQFESTRSSYLAVLPSYSRRLAASIGLINVPPPPHPLHYKSILVLGGGITPQDAQAAVARRERDPFNENDLPYDDVFAFGTAGTTDIGRVALDHLLGQFEHLSATTMAQIGKLKGATADEVVCHSNGCRVVMVLIEMGLLKVGKLRILGGDNAILEIDKFKALKQSKGLSEVSLYMLRGDLVPIIDPGWRIMDLMHKINQPLQTFATSHAGDTVYQLLGMTKRPGFKPGADVQVHMLSYPTSSNPVSQHLYDNYSRVVKGWRMSGCLDPGGAMSRKCIIY